MLVYDNCEISLECYSEVQNEEVLIIRTGVVHMYL